MQLELKESVTIKQADYSEGTLIVEFRSGHKYKYLEVPEDIIYEWTTMSSTPKGSVGNYFYHKIRTKFPYRKVNMNEEGGMEEAAEEDSTSNRIVS